tara:strand:- start:42 stop:239 length:198 start_codon:yes stop_codon:yes gene_type:complete
MGGPLIGRTEMKILQKIFARWFPDQEEGLPKDVAHLKMPRPHLVWYAILDTEFYTHLPSFHKRRY